MRSRREIRLLIRRRRFDGGVEEHRLPYVRGRAVGYYLDDAGFKVPVGCTAHVGLGGPDRAAFLALAEWDCTRPRPGEMITVNILPGKGGDDGGKSPLQTVLTIASLALSFAAPPAGSAFAFLGQGPIMALPKLTWGSIAGFGLMAIGGLVTAPPKPKLSALAQTGGLAKSSPTYRIDDAGNQVQPYGQVPRTVGKVRWKPPLGARSYREVSGKELYYRLLLCLGKGPVNVLKIEVGETDISEFTHEKEIREGWAADAPLTLFPNDVYEDSVGALMRQVDGWVSRNTQAGSEEAMIDVMAPRFAKITGASSREPVSVTLECQYAPLGQETWVDAPWQADGQAGFAAAGKIQMSDNSTVEVWYGGRFKFPSAGQWRVRMRRTSADTSQNDVLDDVYWSSLKSVKYEDPLEVPESAKIAIRFKATSELQGQIPPISVTTEKFESVYDPNTAGWSDQISRNPAWSSLGLLMDSFNPRPRPASGCDLDAFAAFAAHCAAYGLQANGVLDYPDTVLEAFNDVAGAGWGRFNRNSTLYSVVWDKAPDAPVQHFTPHNTIGFKTEKLLPKRPHALLCSFKNEEKNYQRDMRPVYAPGFDELTATDFEEREYLYITHTDQVWKAGMREIAVSIYRDINCELRSRMDYLICRPGQVISATRPRTGWGLGSGRVAVIYPDRVDLTDAVPMSAGKKYSIAFRYGTDASQATKTRKTFDLLPKPADGEYTTVEFGRTDAQGVWQPLNINAADYPANADIFQFGDTDYVGKEFVVTNIDHGDNNQGVLYLTPAGTEVLDAIAGNPPAYQSRLSSVADIDRRPPKPVVNDVKSDEMALIERTDGTLLPRILVFLNPRSGDVYPLVSLEVRYRRTDGAAWKKLAALPPDVELVVLDDVVEGVQYDIELWVVTDAGLVSEATPINAHKVIGMSTPPTDPAGLYVEKLPGDKFRYRVVGTVASDNKGREFRWNPGVNLEWPGAVKAHTGVWTSDTFESTAFIDRTFTVLVKNIDRAGNESTGLSYAVVRLGDQVTDKLVDTVDYGAAAFPGAITGGAVTAGELRAGVSGALFADASKPLFNAPSDALFSGYDTLVYRAILRPQRRGYLKLFMDADGGGTTTYCVKGDDFLYTNGNQSLVDDLANPLFAKPPDIGYAGPFEVRTGLDYDVEVTIPGGPVRGVIRSLKALIDVPVETERLEDVQIAAGGTRLSSARQWEEIIKVGYTVQQALGYSAVTARPADKNATLGPLTYCYDVLDAATAGIIDADIQGIPLKSY